MSSNANQEHNRLDQLQSEYRSSWHAFTVAVEDLQSKLSDATASSETINDARRRVEFAIREYRESRNLLAELLLEGDAARGGCASAQAAILSRSQAA